MRIKSLVEAALLATLLAACAAPADVGIIPSASDGPSQTASPTSTAKPTSKPSVATGPAAGLIMATAGPAWTTAGLGGPTFAAGYCHYRKLPDGQYLQDPRCTPGAIDTRVNDSTLSSTICKSGYTKTIRPPYSLTGPAKQESMLEYNSNAPASAFEYDHLIPLELGGSSSTYNLWPEPNVGGSGGFYINAKDKIENSLKYAVCGGRTTLHAAQQAIVADWETAMTVLGL